MKIILEPIPLLTIYGHQSDIEAYAIAHPDSTVQFMSDWKRKEIESWTFLQPEYAHSYIAAQTDWIRQGGTIFASDCLRILMQQIEVRVRKPTLAAKPGTSLHGLGMAIDYDTKRLGIVAGRQATFREFDKHLRKFGWRVHGRAFTSANHAESWHIQPMTFRGKPFDSNMEVAQILMNEGVASVRGREDEIISNVIKVAGWHEVAPVDMIKRIQMMGGLVADGVVGDKTRGFLALLDVQYEKVSSTYKP